MKKVILVLLSCIALCLQAQTVHKVIQLDSYNMGAVKLVRIDSAYALKMRTNNRYQRTFTVALGNRENAIRLLDFISKLKIDGDDIVELENETDNCIKKGPLGGYAIFSTGGQFSCVITKKQAKDMIKVIEENKGTEVAEETENEEVPKED